MQNDSVVLYMGVDDDSGGCEGMVSQYVFGGGTAKFLDGADVHMLNTQSATGAAGAG